MKNKSVSFIVLMTLVLFGTVQAEQKQVFDGPNGSEYQVHYNAFTSTFLQPEVAKQYQLVRSKALGIINISVIRKTADGEKKAVGSVIEGRMSNDIQQQQILPFQQVVESQSIYYLTQMQFVEGEVLTFDITVYPEGSVQPLKLRFSQTFYNDE